MQKQCKADYNNCKYNFNRTESFLQKLYLQILQLNFISKRSLRYYARNINKTKQRFSRPFDIIYTNMEYLFRLLGNIK